MSILNRIFPNKVCINLDRRPDRWKRMQARFSEHGIRDVRRVPAVDGRDVLVPARWSHSTAAYGCLLSHVEAVSEASQLGLPGLLIFEDDVEFDSRFQERCWDCLQTLPPDWDILFFGAGHMEDPQPISQNLVRVTRAC